tara:strand:+ start:26 stop:784 length:759 start_codon:yes stop_codon:yes gene_type:complete
MTPHIEAKPGDYAKIVLMPGDPLRAKWISDKYIDDSKQVNGVRGMLGFTGNLSWNDKWFPISVQGGGMGMPSNSIYIHELFKFYGVETIIRVGSCGGIAEHVQTGDIVAATTASTESRNTVVRGVQYSPSADWDLLKKFTEVCPTAHVGTIVSNDDFYQQDENWWKEHQKVATLAVEMETYALYTIANQYKKKALSVNTVSDHMQKTGMTKGEMTEIGYVPGIQFENKTMSPEERETGFSKMVEAIFDTLTK